MVCEGVPYRGHITLIIQYAFVLLTLQRMAETCFTIWCFGLPLSAVMLTVPWRTVCPDDNDIPF
jgi:hypothetical protein